MADLRDASTGGVLTRRVVRAVTPWQRIVGFLATKHIEPTRGLWFGSCRAIHTFGMRSAVDVLFLSRDGNVIAVKLAVPPNRLLVSPPGARAILEMGPGFLQTQQINIGDRLELIDAARV